MGKTTQDEPQQPEGQSEATPAANAAADRLPPQSALEPAEDMALLRAAYDQALYYARDLTRAFHAERESARLLRQAWEGTMDAMVSLIDMRDRSTQRHSQRVTAYTERIAVAMGVRGDELDVFRRGALLHDIGKIGVPDSILLKPGPLTEAEWREMRRHPEIGWAALQSLPFLREAATIVLHHHERWDGRGYPSGLSGEAIHLGARIFAVADTLDAMTTDRPYRRALPWSDAVEEIRRQCGRQFDPAVVRAILQVLGELHDLRRRSGAGT